MFSGCQMLFCAVRFTPRTEHCGHQFCPSRNRPCIFLCCFRVRGSLLVRIKSGRVSHMTRLVFFCPLGWHVFVGLFLGAACLSNLCRGLPPLAKICFAFLRSALCAGFFCGLAPPLCHCAVVFLGFRGSVGRRLAVCLSSLPLVSCCSLVFGAATHFLMPRPLLR